MQRDPISGSRVGNTGPCTGVHAANNTDCATPHRVDLRVRVSPSTSSGQQSEPLLINVNPTPGAKLRVR
jgi:hypothetical protein